MKTVTIREAKNRLTELAREVERGETIVVTRNGSPVFELAPHRPRKGLRLEAIEDFKRKRGIESDRGFHRRRFRRSIAGGFSPASAAARRMRLLLDTHVFLALIGPGAASLPTGGRRFAAGRRQRASLERGEPLGDRHQTPAGQTEADARTRRPARASRRPRRSGSSRSTNATRWHCRRARADDARSVRPDAARAMSGRGIAARHHRPRPCRASAGGEGIGSISLAANGPSARSVVKIDRRIPARCDRVRPSDHQLDQGQTKGFTTARPAKRLKSRSADHSARTPCCRHKAAIRASWTCGPAIRPPTSSARNAGQWSVDSAKSTRVGNSSQASTCVQGAREGRGRRVDAGMGDDGEKLVNARPGNRPGRGSLREFGDSLRRRVVKG